MQVFEVLASLDFGAEVSTASYQTETGKQLLEKYQSYVMTNPVTCTLVNNFVNECKQCLYDTGVYNIYEKVCNYINDYKYSWMLATACEKIEGNDSSYNFLNKNAAKQVRKLLEMREDEVISYIKAGALKNVMYCESFRNIAKAVFKDQPIVEKMEKYTKTHPISIVEQTDNEIFFVVASNIYKINENTHEISEANANEVTNEFLQIARILESKLLSYENGTISFQDANMRIEVNEDGIVKICGDNRKGMTVDQLREHNALYVNSLMPQKRNNYANILESIAKVAENFQNICILDSVSVISTPNDLFLTIESGDNMYARSLRSNHRSQWTVNENLFETIQFIKRNTWVDLNEEYQNKIQKVIEHVEKEDMVKIQESLRQSELQSRKEKIEELIEKHKDDPVRMAVLSKAAEKLGKMM